MCSLAATGAAGISGGNYQIFEQFLRRSGASVHLNTNVNSILLNADSKNWTVATTQGTNDYNAVILAAPFHLTDITVPHSISEQIPKQPYVHLHVTLLTTTSEYLNPTYFNLPSSSKPARMMLTTYEGARNGGPEPEFNSLSYHGLVRPGEWAVKIFSQSRMSDELLDRIFNGQVQWVFRKEVRVRFQPPIRSRLKVYQWDAYPKLPPTKVYPPVKLGQGLYYVNSFEPYVNLLSISALF
jgi:prenylcysteine oxidase/farnesylcysteine lyase